MVLILNGCWSKKELNELSLITSMAIDKEDNEYLITLLIVVPSEATLDASGRSSPAMILSSKGVNICDAFRKSTLSLSRAPNLTHVQNVIISEEIAREGISDVLDSLIRDEQLRPNVNVFVAKDKKAKEILSVYTTIENSVSTKIMQLIVNSQTNYSLTHPVTVLQLINEIVNDSQEAHVPGITVEGDLEKGMTQDSPQRVEPYVNVKLVPYAVFQKDKMIGWLDDETSKMLNLVSNEVIQTMLSAKIDDNKYYVLEVRKAKSKIKLKVKDNKPSFDIQVKIEGIICQADCTMDLSLPKNIEKIEQKLVDELQAQIEKSINTIQTTYKSDVIGFGTIIHRTKPKLWKKIKKDWDEIFPEVEFTVQVQVNIKQPGPIINPINKDIK